MNNVSVNILQLLAPDLNEQNVCNDEDNFSDQSMIQMLTPLEFAEMITNDRWN